LDFRNPGVLIRLHIYPLCGIFCSLRYKESRFYVLFRGSKQSK
jgi:hypothetical protein